MNRRLQKSDRRFSTFLCQHNFYENEQKGKKTFVLIDVHSAVCGIGHGLPFKEGIEILANDRIGQ